MLSMYSRVFSEITGTDRFYGYSLGTALRNLGKTEEALQAFAAASSLRSGDDMSRITLENMIMSDLELDDPRRERYAAYHFDLGKEYDNRNLIKRAYQEFRRGLQINPYSKEGRTLLGDIHRRNGYLSRYMEELKIINDMLEEEELDISDELEFLEYRLVDSVSADWGIDQFYLEREKVRLGVFYMNSSMYHQEAEEDLIRYFESILSGYENVELPDIPVKIDSFSQGYRRARESDTDYFIIIDIDETERIISVDTRFYMSETGGEIKKWSIFRTGNHRIPDAFQKLAEDIHVMLPVSGRLVERKFDEGLVSLGRIDGLETDSVFLIIRNGELFFSKEGFGYSYEDDSVLGTFTVTRLDDFVSEGKVEKRHFFDMINQGDYIIPSPPGSETAGSDGEEGVEEDDKAPGAGMQEPVEQKTIPDIYENLLRIQ